MSDNNAEFQDMQVDEVAVLRKFEGDPVPENEFERVTIKNGEIVAHEKVKNGKVVGPVKNSKIVGTTLPEKEVD